MSLDFPAMGSALWALYDSTGIRPEYVLPVLWLESNFNPSIVNSIGCTGINQRCGNVPAGYASLSASQQMVSFVNLMFQNIVANYGALGSATRVYQSNLLPSTLRTATTLDSIIAQKGSGRPIPQSHLTEAQVYSANAGLDANRNGIITVGDLAVEMGKMLQAGAVQQAIAQAYLQRPTAFPDPDPVYGSDFASGGGGSSWGPALGFLAGVAAAAGALYAYKRYLAT